MNEETKKEEKKMRQIIIETDGNAIHIKQAEVAGKLELMAIAEMLLEFAKGGVK
jgi:hypothetical protein